MKSLANLLAFAPSLVKALNDHPTGTMALVCLAAIAALAYH